MTRRRPTRPGTPGPIASRSPSAFSTSDLGGASVGLRGDVAHWIDIFANLEIDALEARSGDRYDFELGELLRVLRDPACAAGILVFWAE